MNTNNQHDDKVVTLVKDGYEPKKGSINEFILKRAAKPKCTFKKLEGMIIKSFKRPKSSQTVDRKFARSAILWLVKEGHVTLK